MIISRNFANGSNYTVWVIPVPASPNSVKVDVLLDIPKFSGYDVSKQADKKLSNIRDALLSTQIYPIVPIIFTSTFGTVGSSFANPRSVSQTLGGAPKEISQDVVVYQHLEKEGMVAEVLSATNSDALYQYLNEKGLKVARFVLSSTQPRPNLLGLGVANCLTLIGTIIGSHIFFKEKRMKFIILFSVIFVVLTLVVLFLLSALYQ